MERLPATVARTILAAAGGPEQGPGQDYKKQRFLEEGSMNKYELFRFYAVPGLASFGSPAKAQGFSSKPITLIK